MDLSEENLGFPGKFMDVSEEILGIPSKFMDLSEEILEIHRPVRAKSWGCQTSQTKS